MRLGRPLVIAARHSDLARLQAYRVGDALRAKHAGLEITYAFRASLGDKNLNDPLWKMPEKGVFTEDFLKDLEEGTADLVVHSWKDLPTAARTTTAIAATLPRADARDLLLFRKDRIDAVRSTGRVRILTSSPRRAYNLEPFLKAHLPFKVASLDFLSVRGNIPTRLEKLLAQDVDAVIVAKAALDRLLSAREDEFKEVQIRIGEILSRTKFMALPLSANPTAAAQGAIAIEINSARADLRELLAAIDCRDTFEAVEKERAILSGHGGGCHQKIGVSVLRRPFGETTFLKGLTDAGVTLDEARLDSAANRGLVIADGKERLFPRKGEEAAAFFTREPLAREAWAWAEAERFLWVARESAWPEGFKPREDAIVWVAGTRTWRHLAERGIWVNGTVDGLGEAEPPRLEDLLGERGLDWVKLTHADSDIEDAGMRHCATYKLWPAAKSPELRDRTHFFWKSGSAFNRALELRPEIREAHHASGPGLTHKHLEAVLGRKTAVFLSVESWRRAVLPGK